jgi:hypothetical protein
MSCPKCVGVVERPDVPHVIRTCEGYGRTLRIHEPGAHGKGLQVKKGDQVVIPADWLRLSLNPLKTNAQFSRFGLQFRFNRRTSRHRGKLFYRVVQQAVAVDPAPYASLVKHVRPESAGGGATSTRAVVPGSRNGNPGSIVLTGD